MKYFIIFTLLGLFRLMFAQPNNCQLTLSSGDTLSNVVLIQVSNDSLNIMQDSSDKWLNVNSITQIRIIKELKIWETAKQYAFYSGIGAPSLSAIIIAISAKGSTGWFGMDNTSAKVLGVIIGAPLYGIAFGLIGGIIGSVIAILDSSDKVYDISQMKLAGKLTTLQGILEQNK